MLGDKKVTDNEIIQALEKILELMCREGDLQRASTISNALDLIKRQKAEIKNKDTEIDILIRKKETLKDEVSEMRAEIERLKRIIRVRSGDNLLAEMESERE
jgi:hypothetical protein